MQLADVAPGQVVTVEHVGGERTFRRRLMELGLVPGTPIRLIGVAPLGDPLELLVRGCSLSIRRADARKVAVSPARAAHADGKTLEAANGSTSSLTPPSWSEGSP